MRKNDKLIEIIKNTLKEEGETNTGKSEKLEAFNHILDTHKRVLLVTGSAGAGKTDVLVSSYIGLMLKGHKVCCMASTALAAVNINNRFKRKIRELSETLEKDSLRTVLNTIENPQATTIHSTMDLKPEKFYFTMSDKDEFSLGKISQHKKSAKKNLEKLMKYDSFFIDEVSMISSNFMDVIMYIVSRLDKKRVKKKKNPVRIILFGDFYQLSPVITDWDNKMWESENKKDGKTIYQLYKEKYGGVYLFDCKRLSERWLEKGKRFGKNYYFELKENHRIDVSGGTERQKRMNREYRNHLATIKDARFILKKANTAIFKDDMRTAIRELIPLNDAIEFFNKRQMSKKEFEKRKDVKNILNNIGEKRVITIAGTNAFRKEMTDYLTELFEKNNDIIGDATDCLFPKPRVFKVNKRICRPEEREEVLKIGFPLSECKLVKNMKVVITKNCRGLALNGEDAIPLFNGQICTIESFEKNDDFECIPIIKNEEGTLIKVFPEMEASRRIVFRKLLTEEQEKECKEKLGDVLINELKKQENYTKCNFNTKKMEKQNFIFDVYNDSGFEKNGPIVYNKRLYSYYGANYYMAEKLPLEPAFALTYHKVQGQEADCIYICSQAKDFIDQNSLYLGLSRGKNLKGLWISRKIPRPLKTTKSGEKVINWDGKKRLERILKYYSNEQKEEALNRSIDDEDYERKEAYYSKLEMFNADRFLDKFKSGSNPISLFPYWFALN